MMHAQKTCKKVRGACVLVEQQLDELGHAWCMSVTTSDDFVQGVLPCTGCYVHIADASV